MQSYKVTTFLATILIALLPLFFIPGGSLALDDAKTIFAVVGVVLLTLSWLFELWKTGSVSLPSHPIMLVILLLPVVYLVSALKASNPFLSLFGYNLEVGTFGYILLGTGLLLILSLVFNDTTKLLKALTSIFISLSLIVLFALIKIVSGGAPVWGIFNAITDSPIGRWTDLSIILGLFLNLLVLVVVMLPLGKLLKVGMYVLFVVATILLCLINFSPAFLLTIVFSVLLLLYFIFSEQRFSLSGERRPSIFSVRMLLPIILIAVSLLMVINPKVPGKDVEIGAWITGMADTSNTIVRPSLSATLNVSRAVLSQAALLGSGPNTFSYEWLIYKPVEVNTTPFWGVTFPFGIGFIPTQVVAIGGVGTLVWLALFVLLIYLGWKTLRRLPDSIGLRLVLITSLVGLLYLWAASFVYPPSMSVLTLAFIFSGIFFAASAEAGIINRRSISIRESNSKKSITLALTLAILTGLVVFSMASVNRTIAALHFKNAVDLANRGDASLEAIETEVNTAIKYVPADIYYTALSRLNFFRAQNAAANTGGTPAENQAIFQESVRNAIDAGRKATEANPRSYQNWVALGIIYSALVPPPLAVDGAYDNAKLTFAEASKRNPFNPEIPLLVAQLEINKGNVEAARALIAESLRLKDNYPDAYLLDARLALAQNNLPDAIKSSERLAILTPNNAGIWFDLGLLKYSTGDYIGAAEVFNNALILIPDYANARFYFGLSLIQLGKPEEALPHFEKLLETNKDNQDLKNIINSLKSGKTPR